MITMYGGGGSGDMINELTMIGDDDDDNDLSSSFVQIAQSGFIQFNVTFYIKQQQQNCC